MGNPARSFDSLAYSNELRKAGVPEDQANLQAKALFTVIDEQLLNKQDLEKVEIKLSSDIKELKAELRNDIKEAKADVERVESKLGADIEKLEAKLSGEIKEVKRDINESELRLKSDIKDSELRLVFRLTGIITLVGALFKFLPMIHL